MLGWTGNHHLIEDNLHTSAALHNRKLDPLGTKVDTKHILCHRRTDTRQCHQSQQCARRPEPLFRNVHHQSQFFQLRACSKRRMHVLSRTGLQQQVMQHRSAVVLVRLATGHWQCPHVAVFPEGGRDPLLHRASKSLSQSSLGTAKYFKGAFVRNRLY